MTKRSGPKLRIAVGGGLSDLSPLGWGRVVLAVIAGSLVSVSAALYVDSFSFAGLDEQSLSRAIAVDIALPLILAVPMLSFLMTKLRQLAIAKEELTILASTDSLTAVLNRGAFRMIVDGYLERLQEAQIDGPGTLLVVDVDHFKGINDDLGHDQGDDALRLIAAVIKGALREIDLVGRIGGEEFGVFLPKVAAPEAVKVAERIRSSVAAVEFPYQGPKRQLSVSVGGATFSKYVPFDTLFKTADQNLYKAKRGGRNRVEMNEYAT